jgi:hypothetical protein
MTTVFLVTHYTPSEVGHGGNHRTYQILHDIERAVGKENIVPINFTEWYQSQPPIPNLLIRYLDKVRRRLKVYLGNPYKLLVFTPYPPSHYSDMRFLNYYKEHVRQVNTPATCIIEHTGFSDLISINSRYGIPTFCCVQNLESLDMGVLVSDLRSRWGACARAIDVINEVRVFSKCAERLFISKVETGIINGLGLASHYYPYLPIGKIRQRFEWIRAQRSQTRPEQGLCVMLGTAYHPPTRAGFEWFLENARQHRLPPQTRLVLAGMGTDTLRSSLDLPGLEFKGQLAQDELDSLLISAQCVLIPQFWGLGTLTRLSELACAGIPVMVSQHPTFASDMPPQIEIVGNTWNEWFSAIKNMNNRPSSTVSNFDDYRAWEKKQPQTLSDLLSRAVY